jgi:hypothetical protein
MPHNFKISMAVKIVNFSGWIIHFLKAFNLAAAG